MGEATTRTGQVSLEYLMIMGFAMLLIVPIIAVYYTQTTQLSEETTSASIQRAATQIVETADSVYFLGEPSSRTITVDIPQNVASVAVNGTLLSFTVLSSHKPYEQNAWSVANMTGTFGLTPGPHLLVISATGNGWVNITER